MIRCEFKKGVFIQRDCESIASYTCAECYIGVCADHSYPKSPSSNDVLCHNCYISLNDITEDAARERYYESKSNAELSLWYSSFRSENTHYFDTISFDDADYQGFIAEQGQEQVYYEDDADFFDS